MKVETKIKRKCEVCGKIFYLLIKNLEYNERRFQRKCGRYCSRECYYKSPARRPNLGRFGKDSIGWKGGIIYERGYKLVLVPDSHPYGILKGRGKKYYREHRLVMEQYLGRYLTPKEIVHHINGNILDNDIKNLFLTDNSTHTGYHKKMYWYKKKIMNR